VAYYQACVGDVRPGEGEVLESPNQAPIDSLVTNRGTRIGGDLGLSVHGCGTRLVVGYTSTFKDIHSVLLGCMLDVIVGLVKQHSRWGGCSKLSQ
jgi:hypothetical protein